MSAKRRQVKDKSNIEWDFFSFPVLCTASFGLLAGLLLYPLGILLQPLGLLTFVAALFGTSYCTAHVMSQWVSHRKDRKQRERLDEDERERRALAARAARAEAQAAAAAATTVAEPRQPKRRRRRSRS